MSFTFQGESYDYCRGKYNAAWTNERCVEVPIIYSKVCAHRPQRVLEIGNVLQHYYDVHHDILDKYEKAPGVVNQDVVDFQPVHDYDLIVSISTFEHIGRDGLETSQRDDAKVIHALENVWKWLSPTGAAWITMPLGYARPLDQFWRSGMLGFSKEYYMHLVKRAEGTWEQGSTAIWEQGFEEQVELQYPFDHVVWLLIGVMR